MSFFDNKEEVIKIELTQFGKFLLSKGKFEPKYYSFHDDDVIYDSQYANLSETQNSTEDRIFYQTPLSKPQVVFSSVENSVLESVQNTISEKKQEALKKEKMYVSSEDLKDNFLLLLGKCSENSVYAPAWNIVVNSGSTKSIKNYVDDNDGISQININIPQMNMNTGSYNLFYYKNEETPPLEEKIFSNNSMTVTLTKKDIPLLYDIIEKNVNDLNENFEIEVFKEEQKNLSNGQTKKFWQKLSFFKRPTSIKNKLLLDEKLYTQVEEKIPDPTNVEYYFELLVDNEIDYGVKPDKTSRSVVVYGIENVDNNPVTGDEC